MWSLFVLSLLQDPAILIPILSSLSKTEVQFRYFPFCVFLASPVMDFLLNVAHQEKYYGPMDKRINLVSVLF